MNRSTTIRRLFGKFALWVLVTLVAVVGLWVALNRFLDESPHNNRVATLETRQARIPESQNIAVGVIGLLAPRGSDFIQHGSMLKAMYESNTPYRQILEAMNGASSLQPTIESHDLYCWLDGTGLDPASCIPFDEAPEILQQNAELLRRFRSLQSLESYSNLFALTNSEIITIARLNLADIRLDLENGKSEEAFQKWKGQLRMTRAMLRGADTWIGKAISLVVFGLTYPSLEEILIANPQLAIDHVEELETLLRPEGIESYNPEGIMRAEYFLLVQALSGPPPSFGEWPEDKVHWLAYYLGQKERTLNRYSLFAQDYSKAFRLPWPQLEEKIEQVRETHSTASNLDIVIDPFGSLFLLYFIDGQLMAQELIHSMHVAEGRLRLASLLLTIISEELEDGEIPEFLADAGPDYFDPLTNTPMQWDDNEKIIYFPDSGNPCLPHASFRIPGREPREIEGSSSGNTRKC